MAEFWHPTGERCTGLAEIHGPPVVPTKLRAAATAYEHAINALTRAAQLAA